MMKFTEIIKQIESSPWRGMISEVGYRGNISYLFSEGENSTIIYSDSPRVIHNTPDCPIVSMRNAIGLCGKLHTSAPFEYQKGPMFYLSVVGSPDIDEGWLCLKTVIPRDEKDEVSTTIINFSGVCDFGGVEFERINNQNRAVIGLTTWILNAMLNGAYDSWSDAIEIRKKDVVEFGGVKICSIQDSRLTVEEHLSVTSFSNPLLYSGGSFANVKKSIEEFENLIPILNYADCEKDFSKLPENSLLLLHDEDLLIKDKEILFKKISKSEIISRINILEKWNIPILLMSGGSPLLSSKAASLKGIGFDSGKFIMDMDDFNNIFNINAIPASNDLFKDMNKEQEITARSSILSSYLKPLHKESGFSFIIDKIEGEIVDSDHLDSIDYNIL